MGMAGYLLTLQYYLHHFEEGRMDINAHLPNVLIVDDEIGPRESLRMILKPNYNVYSAEDGYRALQILAKTEMDVITLDLKMPGMSGVETLKQIRLMDPDVMIIIITGFGTLQSAVEAIRHGVYDYISKPFNVKEIVGIIEKALQRRGIHLKMRSFLKESFPPVTSNGSLLESVPPSLRPGRRFPDGSLKDLGLSDHQTCLEFAKVLASTLEEKDPYTSGHSDRVCDYSDLISTRLSLSPKERNELQIAAYLHDIGKIGISNRFINKKGVLSATDWAIIKQHTRKAVELLSPLNLSNHILSCIEHHHEHFDGSGYPEGLGGNQIPLGARIIAVSDSYDSMTSNRPYRKPLSKEEAKRELLKWAGKQFDPNLVSVFLHLLKELEGEMQERDPFRASSYSF
jgi:putative two-component system response regulator